MMPFPVHKINGSPKLKTGFQGGSQGHGVEDEEADGTKLARVCSSPLLGNRPTASRLSTQWPAVPKVQSSREKKFRGTWRGVTSLAARGQALSFHVVSKRPNVGQACSRRVWSGPVMALQCGTVKKLPERIGDAVSFA